MKQKLGMFFIVGGMIVLIYTGMNYISNTESFGFLGVDFLVSEGDPFPVIISAVVFIVGVLILSVNKAR